LKYVDRNTRISSKTQLSDDETNAAANRLSQVNEKHAAGEPWFSDSATGRVGRLQSNAAVDSSERRKRRNDTLFLGKSLLI
jgi:hypothetical protein